VSIVVWTASLVTAVVWVVVIFVNAVWDIELMFSVDSGCHSVFSSDVKLTLILLMGFGIIDA